MRKQHVLQTMLTWMLIVCLGTRFVYADTTERPDLNRTVDLHLRLESVEEEVKREAGAEVCIYHIAEMQDLGGEITFVYTDDWADMSWDLSESVPVEKVREMSDLAEENALSGQSKVSEDLRQQNNKFPSQDVPPGLLARGERRIPNPEHGLHRGPNGRLRQLIRADHREPYVRCSPRLLTFKSLKIFFHIFRRALQPEDRSGDTVQCHHLSEYSHAFIIFFLCVFPLYYKYFDIQIKYLYFSLVNHSASL